MATTSIAEAREAHSELTTKLNQLEAFLLMTFGRDRGAFAALAPASQDDYMAACTYIVQSCQKLTVTIAVAVREEVA